MFTNKDYIYCVYRERSFSKAADKLHISQPSLSATIAKAERKLGMKIFERKTKPISLTPFGIEYIRGIEQINEVEEYLQTLSYDVHTLQSGSLSIGASNLSIASFIPQMVARFKKLYPKIHLDLVDTSAVKSSHMLDSGELDMVITNWPYDPSRYTQEICYTEHLVLAIPKEFPVNRILRSRALDPLRLREEAFDVLDCRDVSLSEVAHIPFILLRHTSALRQCADMLFKECELEPEIALEVDYSAIAYNMASLGIGATIVSNRLAADCRSNDSFYHYRIRSQYCKRSAYICYSKGRYLTTAMKKFIEMIHTQ